MNQSGGVEAKSDVSGSKSQVKERKVRKVSEGRMGNGGSRTALHATELGLRTRGHLRQTHLA